MPSILLPIKPIFVDKIFSGTKKYEFRKTNFKRSFDKVIIYETSPVKLIVGEFSVSEIIIDSPKNVWKLCHKSAGIARKHFFEYFNGKKIALAIAIDGFVKYENPKSLSQLNIDFVPQSAVYLD